MKGKTSFKIYPDNGKNFYSVHIFSTRAEMHTFREKSTESIKWSRKYKATADSECEAITHSWGTPRGNEEGQVLFYEGSCNARIVSHEFTHAALYWIKNQGVKSRDLYNKVACDELLAFTQGEMVGQFWNEYWKKIRRGVSWLRQI